MLEKTNIKKFSLFYLIFSLSLMSVYADTPSVKESVGFILVAIIIWLFVALCIHIANGMISSKKAHYTDSLAASLVGFVAVFVAFLLINNFILAAIIAIFAWLAVIMSMLNLDFGQSIAVTIVAVFVYIILALLLAVLVGVAILHL